MDSARQNLASSFVNGFVNTGFGKDKLLTDDGNKWLYKNKDHGKMKPKKSFNCFIEGNHAILNVTVLSFQFLRIIIR